MGLIKDKVPDKSIVYLVPISSFLAASKYILIDMPHIHARFYCNVNEES